MSAPAPERFIVIKLECPHCKEEQNVHVRARTGFRASNGQDVICLKCETAFYANVPDTILAGPFLITEN